MTADANFIRYALGKTADDAAARGMPRLELKGQLIRPMLAYEAAMYNDTRLSPQFWSGALAIQLAHEASLVHDDIVDEAKTRRGSPTVVASRGIGAALVTGDHLLTASYRLAAETRSIDFVSIFASCVERTVAGEIEQAKSLGRVLSFEQYRRIAESKSGELLAASLALGAALDRPSRIEPRLRLGRQFGLLYQMLDDLLDYCPATDTGKAAYGDFRQKRWTWPLGELSEFSFDKDTAEVSRQFAQGALVKCLARIECEARALRAGLDAEFEGARACHALIDEWISRAREAVRREQERGQVSPSREHHPSRSLLSRVPPRTEVVSYLAANSKSFRFAARFFPHRELSSVARVYAFCRVTDDIVDRSDSSAASELLDEWVRLARGAYDGISSGIPILDEVMSEMSVRSIPFDYAAQLAAGMQMDIRGERYQSLSDLREYTYRVASVVGLWLTELAGVRRRSTLRHAESLGHAMQMTNILRDVGEDARNGRLYLPLNRIKAHGITPEAIFAAAAGQSAIPHGFANLVEELLRLAERDYAFALTGVRDLPSSFQRPVAIAGHVYRGIHSEIRRSGYDTLTQRAVTSTKTKAVLAARAIWDLQTAPQGILRTA